MNIKHKKSTKIIVCCILSFGAIIAEEIQLKVKTTPDFPEGPPPMDIYWDGVKVGVTQPGESVKIMVDLTKEKKLLKVGDTQLLLWKSGMSLKGETINGNVKLRKGPTVLIKSDLSPTEILTNALEYHTIFSETLRSPNISDAYRIRYTDLLSKLYSYEYKTEGVSASITGTNPVENLIFFNFSYYGLVEKSWRDTLKITEDYFSGKKPQKGSMTQVFVEHWTKIPKYGVLKISWDGTIDLVSVKTEKYKWGTYKKNNKKRKKHILPITFYVR